MAPESDSVTTLTRSYSLGRYGSQLRQRSDAARKRSRSLNEAYTRTVMAVLDRLRQYVWLLKSLESPSGICEMEVRDDSDDSDDSEIYSEEIMSHVEQSLARVLEVKHLLHDASDVEPLAGTNTDASLLQRLVSQLEALQLIVPDAVRYYDGEGSFFEPSSTLGILKDYLVDETGKLSAALSSSSTQFAAGVSQLREGATQLKDGASESLSNFTSNASDSLSHFRSNASDSLSSLKANATDSFSHLKTNASDSLSHLRNNASDSLSHLKHNASDSLSQIARSIEIGRKRLLLYDELPLEWRSNEYILSGYRYISISQGHRLLYSAFQWHNETINIHSHLLGFLSLVYLLLYLLPLTPSATHMDVFISTLFIVAAMKCLLCSCAWHLLSGCADSAWYRGAACVDYVGISGLIAASVIGAEYYGFYCHRDLAYIYMSASAAMGLSGMWLSWQEWFNKSKIGRIVFFVSLAASSIMPLTHMGILFGYSSIPPFLLPVLPSLAAYGIGLLFYAKRFPECASPGRCDHIFASHQFWHVAIVVAIWMHWRALNIWALITIDERINPSCLRSV